MATYKLVNADQLDADLKSLADRIRFKAGTSETLSFPEGFRQTVDDIPAGVTVQRKTGSFTTNSNGVATVDCGFKPDAVFLVATTYGGKPTAIYAAVPFYEIGATTASTYVCGPNSSYAFAHYALTQNSSGFSVTHAKRYDTSFDESNDSYRTINYFAIKYS